MARAQEIAHRHYMRVLQRITRQDYEQFGTFALNMPFALAAMTLAWSEVYGTPQCLDETSDDFGKLYFVPGVHQPGDPNHPPAPSDP